MSTNNIPCQYKKENHSKSSKSADMGFFFKDAQESVRISCGKRAISVRATEGLLCQFYHDLLPCTKR